MYRKSSDRVYYVYSYVRSVDSKTAPAGTPYYIGKGRGRRTKERHDHVPIPADQTAIIKIAEHLTEPDAHQLEMLLIYFYGRVDIGTGILRNRTDGGDGVSGRVVSTKTREQISAKHKGVPKPEWAVAKQRGSKRSPETIAKLKARVFTEEWRMKISKSRIKNGCTMTDAGKQRVAEAQRNKVVSEATREKLRQRSLGNNYGSLTVGHRAPLKKGLKAMKTSGSRGLFE
jgi:hypothetical protein